MKENLFGWNWFIWAVAGYGRPHAISNSFNSFQSSLQNGKIDWIDECCGGCGTKPNSNHWNWLRNCLARSVWWKELNCGLLSLLPAAVMGAAAPRAPPKGRQANPAIQWNPIKQSLSLSAMKRKLSNEIEWNSIEWSNSGSAAERRERAGPQSYLIAGLWAGGSSGAVELHSINLVDSISSPLPILWFNGRKPKKRERQLI